MPESTPVNEETVVEIIKEKNIEDGERTTEYESNVSDRVRYSDEINQVVKNLNQIQAIFENNLRSVIGCVYTGDDDIEVEWETPDYYIISDSDGVLSEALKYELELNDASVTAHKRCANRLLNLYPEKGSEVIDQWVIRKPRNWAHGQWVTDTLISNLIRRGLSPTQAVDYWMVEVQDKPLPRWADIRGTSPQAIRGTIENAKEAIQQSTPQYSYLVQQYFKTVYSGEILNGEKIARVNGGHLHSRRDVRLHSTTGNVSWGYTGSGPRQLSVAILSDALETYQIPSSTVDEFTKYLNNRIGDDEEWKIIKEIIIEWIEDREKA